MDEVKSVEFGDLRRESKEKGWMKRRSEEFKDKY